ncbi:unnamed protein product [Symbiodinium necroappetens]|uniref:Succinate--hydroxymethylglutarate CoA-transferase n=1 Tax=Symbiodinium necroappetens TaxID=1628268 RepID=A0A813A521_9DINO|nr:unnamed protein product [Symbiodinium necroappetens]
MDLPEAHDVSMPASTTGWFQREPVWIDDRQMLLNVEWACFLLYAAAGIGGVLLIPKRPRSTSGASATRRAMLPGMRSRRQLALGLCIANAVRCFSLFLEIENREGRLTDLLQQLGPTQMQWLWDLISLFPTVVYLSAFSIVVSFFAQLHYAINVVPLPLLDCLVVCVNIACYFLVVAVAVCTYLLCAYHHLRAYLSCIIGFLYVILAWSMLYYGMMVVTQLAEICRKDPPVRMLITRVGVVSVFCPALFLVRAVCLLGWGSSMAAPSTGVDLLLALCSEWLPTVVVIACLIPISTSDFPEELTVDSESDPDSPGTEVPALHEPLMARPPQLRPVLQAEFGVHDVLAGPSVGQFLAELGADVVKVENRKTGGDVTRSWRLRGDNPQQATSYFSCCNLGKRSLAVDASTDRGRDLCRRLAISSDIVIASYKPGDDVKLGLDAAQLRAQAPRLIYAQITGYGLNDPRTGYDAVIQAESGFTFMNGAAAHQGGSPTKMPVALVDLLAAHQLKEAILLALFNRERFGEGAHVHVSLMAAAVASLANQATGYLITGEVPQRMGSDHPSICPYGTAFSDQDGEALVLAVGTDTQFTALCEVLRRPDLAADPRYLRNVDRVINRKELHAALGETVARWRRDELLAALCERKAPWDRPLDTLTKTYYVLLCLPHLPRSPLVQPPQIPNLISFTLGGPWGRLPFASTPSPRPSVHWV